MKRELKNHGISMWRHFFDRERTARELVESMIRWQGRWKWDFLKINPPACYHALPWGAEYEFFNDPLREPKLRKPVVTTEEDAKKIGIVDAMTGELGEQLRVIRNLRIHFGSELPILETVFSPIEIAHRLFTGRDAFTAMRKSSPNLVHQVLENITSTFVQFCIHCLDAGANGIFFATKWASKDLMTWEEYDEFGKQYEMRVLKFLNDRSALIIFHVCGERTFLEQMLDYPVDAFSYDFFADQTVEPKIVIERTGKQVIGGIDPELLVKDPKAAAEKCRPFAELEKWIVGPSCVIPPTISDKAIEEFRLNLR